MAQQHTKLTRVLVEHDPLAIFRPGAEFNMTDLNAGLLTKSWHDGLKFRLVSVGQKDRIVEIRDAKCIDLKTRLALNHNTSGWEQLDG